MYTLVWSCCSCALSYSEHSLQSRVMSSFQLLLLNIVQLFNGRSKGVKKGTVAPSIDSYVRLVTMYTDQGSQSILGLFFLSSFSLRIRIKGILLGSKFFQPRSRLLLLLSEWVPMPKNRFFFSFFFYFIFFIYFFFQSPVWRRWPAATCFWLRGRETFGPITWSTEKKDLGCDSDCWVRVFEY